MPEKRTIKKAQQKKQEGKAPSTQAGPFVHEEIKHIRKGKHGAKNVKQAIAIGLSKARRAGVEIPPLPGGKANMPEIRNTARIVVKKTSPKKSLAGVKRMLREPKGSASTEALSIQTKGAAKQRGKASLHAAALKAIKTKGKSGLRSAAAKAARTRAAQKTAA
ncbi:MAG: DNA-binding protein [Bdellovibrionota bacterium]